MQVWTFKLKYYIGSSCECKQVVSISEMNTSERFKKDDIDESVVGVNIGMPSRLVQTFERVFLLVGYW